MKGARWMLLICVHAAASTNPRSVNLALETTFEFNEKKDMAFIKNMRHFFDKIESNIEKKLIEREREDYRFTDFLQEIIAVLISYDDSDFRSVFKELYHVINNQRKGGAELSDIMSNARPALLEAIRRGTEIPTRLLKDRLKRISLLLGKTDKTHASFVNFLNLLYKGKSPMTLKRIIRGFRLLRKRPNPESQLRQLVKNAAEYLVYEHYAGLDASVKRDVGKWLRSMVKRDASLASRSTLKPKATTTLPKQRYSLVTLYPEPIDSSLKRYRDQVTAWKRVTLKNQGRFLLVKGQRRSNGNMSGESEESSWSSLEIASTVKKSPTSIYRKLSQRKTDPVTPRSFYLDHSYRREINTSAPLEAKNITYNNDSVSQIYLNRLKQLEDQLKEMKRELKARLSLSDVTIIQSDIEYDNMAADKESFEGDTKKDSKAPDVKENGTELIQTRFRTAMGNRSLVLGDSQLSTEIKEFLRKKPEILNVAVTHSARDVSRINDTVTNSTIEANIELRSRDVKESPTTTVGNITTKLEDVSQGSANVTTATTKMVMDTNSTTIKESVANTTSSIDYLNNTIIL